MCALHFRPLHLRWCSPTAGSKRYDRSLAHIQRQQRQRDDRRICLWPAAENSVPAVLREAGVEESRLQDRKQRGKVSTLTTPVFLQLLKDQCVGLGHQCFVPNRNDNDNI